MMHRTYSERIPWRGGSVEVSFRDLHAVAEMARIVDTNRAMAIMDEREQMLALVRSLVSAACDIVVAIDGVPVPASLSEREDLIARMGYGFLEALIGAYQRRVNPHPDVLGKSSGGPAATV